MKMKQFLQKLSVSFVMVFAIFLCSMEPAQAKLGNSYFWGITANFESQGFDGTIVVDDDGKFDEAMHSIAYGTGYVKINHLRCGDKSAVLNVHDKGCAYYLVKGQISGGDSFDDSKWGVGDNSGDNTGVTNEGWDKLEAKHKQFLKWSKDNSSSSFTHIVCKNWIGDLNATPLVDGVTACTGREKNAIYTWPGVANAGDAGAEDEAMLNWVNSTIIPEFNDALSFILNHSTGAKWDLDSVEGKMQFLDFAAIVASNERLAINKGTRNASIDINGAISVNYKMSAISNDEYKSLDTSEPGTTKEDFVKITIGDGNGKDSMITRWRVPKGYQKEQRLDGILEGRGFNEKNMSYVSKYITSETVIYQAMFNYYTTGQTALSTADFYKGQSSWIERQVYNIFDGLINGFNNILNLYSMEDMFLNTGTRGVRYWMGVIPTTWFNASQYFYLFTFSVSMIILLVSLIKLAFEKGLSSIGNAARRVSLMEGIKKTILASIAVVLFSSIFTILCQINWYIVNAISGLVDGEILFSSTALGGGTLATIIIMLVFFFINLKMNFTYMLRGITLLICYLIGPICIMCSALGEKYALITQNWTKELIGNIFIQSIHALIMMLFISVSRYGSQTAIEKFVLVYSFIPLTEFIRTNIFALGKGMDDVAENLGQTAGGLVAGGAAMAGGFAAKGLAKGVGKGVGAGVSAVKGKMGIGSSTGKGGLTAGKVGAKAKIAGALNGLGKAAPGALGHMVSAGGMAMAGLASGAANAQGRSNGTLTFGALREAGSAISEFNSDFQSGIEESTRDATNAFDSGDSGSNVHTLANGTTVNDINNEALKDSVEARGTGITAVHAGNGGNVIIDSQLDKKTFDTLQNSVNYDAKHGGRKFQDIISLKEENGKYMMRYKEQMEFEKKGPGQMRLFTSGGNLRDIDSAKQQDLLSRCASTQKQANYQANLKSFSK